MGMFGNRYDTMSVLDDAVYKEGLGVGQLSSYGVGQMAAYTEGLMGNPFAAAVNDLMSPEMQKQKILDELQKKHPSPDTPEELQALADDLMANGFGDMAQKVRLEATELLKVQATKAANVIAANTPKDAAFNRLTNSLANRVITKDVVHGFLQTSWNDTEGDRYGEVGKAFSVDTDDENWKRQYDYDYKQAYEQLKGEVENYSIYTQAQSPTNSQLNKLLLDPDAQIAGLKAYIEDLGNTTTANYLSSVNILAPTPKSKPKSTNVEAAPSTISFSGGGLDEDILELLNK